MKNTERHGAITQKIVQALDHSEAGTLFGYLNPLF